MKLFLTILAACAVNLTVLAETSSDAAACIAQLRSFAPLFNTFAASHDGQFPKSFEELSTSQRLLSHSQPSSHIDASKAEQAFELVVPARRISAVANPAATVLVRSRHRLTDGKIPALFVDGHVEFLSQEH